QGRLPVVVGQEGEAPAAQLSMDQVGGGPAIFQQGHPPQEGDGDMGPELAGGFEEDLQTLARLQPAEEDDLRGAGRRARGNELGSLTAMGRSAKASPARRAWMARKPRAPHSPNSARSKWCSSCSSSRA